MMLALLALSYSESRILQPKCFSLPDLIMPTIASIEDIRSLEKIGITVTYMQFDDMKAMQASIKCKDIIRDNTEHNVNNVKVDK